MNEATQLFKSFSKPDLSEWKKAASAEINGEDPEENLKWSTPDGQEFLPYYSPESVAETAYLQKFIAIDRTDPYAARSWANMPSVAITDEATANERALQHLSLEAEGVFFQTDSPHINFGALLDKIQWEHCSVSFLGSNNFPINDLINYISQKRYSYGNIQGAIFWGDEVQSAPALPSQHRFRLAGIAIPESTPVAEIADALTRGVDTIGRLLEKGHSKDGAINHIAFSIPLSTQLFPDIAKLRALRMLWYQVVKAYGVEEYEPGNLYIHGRSAKWINEKFQPHGNMLKSTIASIAGISGGVNALTIEPEDPDNGMMNRIARNTSTILREESHLGKVSDPFAGAYGIEVLTDRIARDAWKAFQSKQ